MAVSSLGLWLSSKIIPGVFIESWSTLILASLLLGLVNAVVKPILIFLTFPVTIITLGLFLLVINGAMLGLVAWLLPGFALAGLLPAILCWMLMAAVSGIAQGSL